MHLLIATLFLVAHVTERGDTLSFKVCGNARAALEKVGREPAQDEIIRLYNEDRVTTRKAVQLIDAIGVVETCESVETLK